MQKIIVFFTIISFLFDAVFPSAALALTGGPSQPEMQSFEPIGTSDMVDLFSGDFNYNIPLLDVDGYPINISYHSGITMDQEASWVGLGWNINPGVVNRSMRGIPDDFNGDQIVKEFNVKPNRTYGLTAGGNLELFGLSNLGISFSLGMKYNNYNGVSVSQGLNATISAGEPGKSMLTGNLGINSSSDEGLTISPEVSFTSKTDKDGKAAENSLSAKVGSSFNSRAGLKQLTFNVDANTKLTQTIRKVTSSVPFLSYNGYGGTFDFGTPTVSPQITLPMNSFAISANFKTGLELFGAFTNLNFDGYFSSQKLAFNSSSNPSYGYMHSEGGQYDDNAIMDFNREKDQSWSPDLPDLPLTNYTFDTYAVSGQGTGGSYRPFRSDLGFVHDASSFTNSGSLALGFEIGGGGVFKIGSNPTVSIINSNSGTWTNNNNAVSVLKFRKTTSNPLYESVYFKEANEKSVDADSNFYNNIGKNNAERFDADFSTKYYDILNSRFVDQNGNKKNIPTANYRANREKRNQVFSYLTQTQYQNFSIQPNANVNNQSHPSHIYETYTLGSDGSRYVYGIPAYNLIQKEVTFAVGNNDINHLETPGSLLSSFDATRGSIGYNPGSDDSTTNTRGIDNYFNRITTPGFAHSYLLTSILSPDYVDADAIRGPSDGDLGKYTRFVYTKISNYKWRTPHSNASFNEGLKSDKLDDKANYIYGEKELWFLDTVITKNYIAIFHKSNRHDARGVINKDGGLGTGSASMMRLDSISLYSKPDFVANPNTLPIKRVHFEYDYSLCKQVPNNDNGLAYGKLTLNKIFFTYYASNKARFSPYEFQYSPVNPNYNEKSYDRWGNYKPNTATSWGVNNDLSTYLAGPIPTPEYPYVEQDSTTANQYTSAWSLSQVTLPSGGIIQVDYESDDYAYVQDKRAMQMFKVINYENDAIPSEGTAINMKDQSLGDMKFYFKLQPGSTTNIAEYFSGITNMYFRFLVNMKNTNGADHYEYVSGYAPIDSYGIDSNNPNLGWVKLQSVSTKDNGGHTINPVVKASIQFGRLHLPRIVWGDDLKIGDNSNFGLNLLNAIISSNILSNMIQAFQGPNDALWNKDVGVNFASNKSWFKLNNPNKRKFGGGCRVKKIQMLDQWGAMVNNLSQNFNYGQEYNYKLDDGTSSGVALYEPMLGNDENPWKQPVFYSTKKLLAPDDKFYMEEPFGESFFPSPGVGYSKVTVKNLSRTGVTRHATGRVVHEFYTGKDFPTIPIRTGAYANRDKDNPFSLASIFKVKSRDFMTATEGFSVELNDMHGKPKSQSVYQEGITTPITQVEYRYKQAPYLNGSARLINNCTVINNTGTVFNADIGRFFDFVADFREETSETHAATIQLNDDAIPFIASILPIFVLLPATAKDQTRFHSATTTKVIQRFGILEETIAKDLGSVVSTKNLAWDAETGEVLLTQTTTDYNDAVYSFKFPAYWYYTAMGPAYKNIGFVQNGLSFSVNGVANIANANLFYSEGDELALTGSNSIRGWVVAVTNNNITVWAKDGNPVTGAYNSMIIRSGYRNSTIQEMAKLTTLSNPLHNLQGNVYDKVLQASAIEFTNAWRTYCDCFTQNNTGIPFSSNPYVLGTKGNFHPKASYLYLTNRTQTKYDANTNIRKDGLFTSFNPFYRYVGAVWNIDYSNWTFTSKVTEFNPFGDELENTDALGRYSAAEFGYNQTQATAVAANSKYRNMGADNFEDYAFSKCADNHFKFDRTALTLVNTESHTGKYSIKVNAATPAFMTKQLLTCAPDSCTLSVNTTGTDSTISISGGTGPFSIDWDISQGSPNIVVSGNALTVHSLGLDWTFQLTIIDANGCRVIKNFKYVRPSK